MKPLLRQTTEGRVDFLNNGRKFMSIDLTSDNIQLFTNLQEASDSFWKTIHHVLKTNNWKTISLSLVKTEKIRVEPGKILHEIYNPEASFILSEFERRYDGPGNDDAIGV